MVRIKPALNPKEHENIDSRNINNSKDDNASNSTINPIDNSYEKIKNHDNLFSDYSIGIDRQNGLLKDATEVSDVVANTENTSFDSGLSEIHAQDAQEICTNLPTENYSVPERLDVEFSLDLDDKKSVSGNKKSQKYDKNESGDKSTHNKRNKNRLSTKKDPRNSENSNVSNNFDNSSSTQNYTRKKARIVEIPDYRPLDYDEFVDIRDHALNSSIWICQKMSRNSKQIKDRLFKKGYTFHEVDYVDVDGETKSFDIMDYVVKNLEKDGYVDNISYAKSVVQSDISSGKSGFVIKSNLYRKGFDRDVIDEAMEKADNTDYSAIIQRKVREMYHSSSIKNLDNEWAKKNKIIQSLARKGFSFDDIRCEIEKYLEESHKSEENW